MTKSSKRYGMARVATGACVVVFAASGCGAGASVETATQTVPASTAGTIHTGRPHPLHHRDAPHFAYSGRILHACVDGHGELTVFEESTPRSICILRHGVLSLTLSPTGPGQRWLRPTVTGAAIKLGRFHRFGRGATFVLTASARGLAVVHTGFVSEEGSSRGWAPAVRVP
jgi:hypothetical protein